MGISLDKRDWDAGRKKFKQLTEKQSQRALRIVGDELLRLSEREVPHDTGQLQGSGKVQPEGDDIIVGYNKVYAAYLHENPQFRFQKGRKGKYLEDPLKRNMMIFIQYYKEEMSKLISK